MKIIEVELNVQVGQSPNVLEVTIGDFQPGSHVWKKGIRPDIYPNPQSTIWTTTVRNAKGNYMYWTSAVLDRNPNTNWVSVDVAVNGEAIHTEELEYEAKKNQLVEFRITLNFI
ncbi:hypothetical protein O3Q51_17005 [Cryomorphaceae bacterium 1068]|nr:hypothetical protein [Cryomorphaceae bacterium 1068]